MPLAPKSAEVLEKLIEAESDSADAILFAVEEPSLRMIASWRRLRKEYLAPESPTPASDEAKWAWLWGQVRFQIDDWARLAAVALPTARRLAIVLVENRVVYPDGSVNVFAAKYVQKRALKIASVKLKAPAT